MGYFANGFLFSAEPSWASLADHFGQDVFLRGYRHRERPLFALDAWQGVTHDHYPFTDELRPATKAAASLPPATQALLERLKKVLRVVGKLDPVYGDTTIPMAAAASMAAGVRTFFFTGDDDACDVACIAEEGILQRVRVATESHRVDYRDGELHVVQRFLDEDELEEIDLEVEEYDDVLKALRKLPDVTIGDRIVTEDGDAIHQAALDLWPFAPLDPEATLGLGTFDAFQRVERDFEVVFERAGTAPKPPRKRTPAETKASRELPPSVTHRIIDMVASMVADGQQLHPPLVRALLGSKIDATLVRQLYRSIEYTSGRMQEHWHDQLAEVLPEHVDSFPPRLTDATARQIFDAIERGDWEGVERFVDEASHHAWSLDFVDARGRTPLACAEERGDPDMVQLLRDQERGIEFDLYLGFTLKEIERRASKGDARALTELARRRITGERTRKDVAGAYEPLRAAADAWHPPALYLLGMMHGEGDRHVDARLSRELVTEAAMMGYPPAQLELAELLLPEKGLEAVYWMEAAAERGMGLAAHRLSQMYGEGEGVDEWPEGRIRWLTRAAEMQETEAILELASCYRDGEDVECDPVRAFELFEAGAALGDAECAFALAYALETGSGTAVDLPAALATYRRAAEDGVPMAWFRMGLITWDEDGGKDDSEARSYFERGVADDNPESKFGLAQMLMTSKAPSGADLARAAHLLHEAADDGIVLAKFSLATSWEDEAFAAKVRAAGKSAIHVAAGGRKERFPLDVHEALPWAKSAAREGHVESCLALATWYGGGSELPKDQAQASKWLRAASDLGSVEAKFLLARRLEQGIAQKSNPAEALKLYELCADEEHGGAAYEAGRCHRDGVGTTASRERAAEYFRLAAELGEARGLVELGFLAEEGGRPHEAIAYYEQASAAGNCVGAYNIGQMYRFGKGVDRDLVKAEHWYRVAADDEDLDAMRMLGKLLLGSDDEGRKREGLALLNEAADEDDPASQRALGEAYAFGDGVEVDREKALEWLRKAAQQDDRRAQYLTGILLLDGGVEDWAEAARWLAPAAESGLAEAQVAIGMLHHHGQGVAADSEEAKRWFHLAMAQGSTEAMVALGRILRDEPQLRSKREAVRLFREAAFSEPMGALMLGLCYDEGCGVDRDRAEGARWIEAARSTGDEEVIEFLEECD